MASHNPPPPIWPWLVLEDPAFGRSPDPLPDQDPDEELEQIWEELEASFTGILIY
jgi:hypothetical protein